MKRSSFALCLLGFVTSCADVGQRRASVELAAQGAPSPVLVDGAWTITLTRADVAFGPAYFCATAAVSSELCTTAVLEFLDAAPIDGLDPIASPLGTLAGVTGTVRSAQYDLGIAFLLTQSTPAPLPGAIGGHSAVIEATATDGVTSFDLAISVDVTAKVSGTTAIVGEPILADVPPDGATLTVSVDPREWLRGLDWAALASTPHAPGAPVVVTKGSVSYDSVLRSMTVNHRPALLFAQP